MPDHSKISHEPRVSQKYFLPGFAFALAGMMLHPAFFLAALVCLTLAMPTRRQKILMAAASGLFLHFLMLSFGYGVGKDMALRDNQSDASSQQKTP